MPPRARGRRAVSTHTKRSTLKEQMEQQNSLKVQLNEPLDKAQNGASTAADRMTPVEVRMTKDQRHERYLKIRMSTLEHSMQRPPSYPIGIKVNYQSPTERKDNAAGFGSYLIQRWKDGGIEDKWPTSTDFRNSEGHCKPGDIVIRLSDFCHDGTIPFDNDNNLDPQLRISHQDLSDYVDVGHTKQQRQDIANKGIPNDQDPKSVGDDTLTSPLHGFKCPADRHERDMPNTDDKSSPESSLPETLPSKKHSLFVEDTPAETSTNGIHSKATKSGNDLLAIPIPDCASKKPRRN